MIQFRQNAQFYFFINTELSGEFSVRYSPGEQNITDGYGILSCPWAELQLQREMLSGALAPLENTPFSAEEQAVVIRHLEELRAYVHSAAHLTQAQMQSLDAEVAYLADAATRSGRDEWRRLFLSSIFMLVLEAAAPPDVLRQAMRMVLHGLAALFGVHAPELPMA